MARTQKVRPLAFKLVLWEFFEKLIILVKINENCSLEKFILKLRQTATINLRQIERDHNGQSRVCTVIWGQLDVRLWRNCDFPTEDEDLEKCVLELWRTATIERIALDHNGQTQIYRLVWGLTEVWFQRNGDFPTEVDDCALLPPRKIRVNERQPLRKYNLCCEYETTFRMEDPLSWKIIRLISIVSKPIKVVVVVVVITVVVFVKKK